MDLSSLPISQRTILLLAGMFLLSGCLLRMEPVGPEDPDDDSTSELIQDTSLVFIDDTSFFHPTYDDQIFTSDTLTLAPFGRVQWERASGSGGTVITRIRTASDGGLMIGGYKETIPPQEGAIFLLRTDAEGRTIWRRGYGSNRPGMMTMEDMITTGDGGWILCGTVYGMSGPVSPSELYVLKLRADGEVEWRHTMHGSGEYVARSVIETRNGTIATCGMIQEPSTQTLAAVFLRLAASGAVLWERRFPIGWGPGATCIRETPDNGLLATVMSEYGATSLYRLDADGTLSWQRVLADAGYTYGIEEFCPAPGGGYVAAGVASDLQYMGNQVSVMKFNDYGEMLWTYVNHSGSMARDVRATRDGGCVVAATGSGSVVVRLNSNGGVRWVQELPASRWISTADEALDGGIMIGGVQSDPVVFTFVLYLAKLSD